MPPPKKVQHLNVVQASRITSQLLRNIDKAFLADKHKEQVKRLRSSKRGNFPIPNKELRQLEIIYGDSLLKAIRIIKGKFIEPILDASSKKVSHLKIHNLDGNFYKLSVNSIICPCLAFVYRFQNQSKQYQCKHLLAVRLLKYISADFTYSEIEEFFRKKK